MNPLPLTDADLMAYADGQLAAARIAEVEQLGEAEASRVYHGTVDRVACDGSSGGCRLQD